MKHIGLLTYGTRFSIEAQEDFFEEQPIKLDRLHKLENPTDFLNELDKGDRCYLRSMDGLMGGSTKEGIQFINEVLNKGATIYVYEDKINIVECCKDLISSLSKL